MAQPLWSSQEVYHRRQKTVPARVMAIRRWIETPLPGHITPFQAFKPLAQPSLLRRPECRLFAGPIHRRSWPCSVVFGFADSVYTALFTTVDAVNMGTHNMPMTSDFLTRTTLAWATLSPAQKILCAYGLLMALALPATWLVSWGDLRQLREVGIWAKPMKFMAATAAFAWTTVWLSTLAPPQVGSSNRLVWIVGLIITTSFFEVAYISWQAAMGSASHYNISDPLHAALFGLMGVAAVCLVASQAWLA